MTNFEHLMLCICFSVNLGFILGSALFAVTEIIEKIKKKLKQ
nr:MAG TPA: Myc target protein 1 [Caudoviricetes sp.]